jgi:hypothetical protein
MVSIELPKYKSHKEVWALKIKQVYISTNTSPDGILYFEDERYNPITLGNEYFEKHKPHAGGYYVVYEDGYKSFSPLEPFENGNTLIKETTFLERLINEEKELGEKISGLNKGLYSDGFAEKVGDYQFELLNLQHDAMITYRRVLIMRIKDLSSK